MRLLTPDDIRPYQWDMARFTYDVPHSALLAQPGLGKTVSSLLTIRRTLREGTVSRWLIVAPLLVAETVWPDEINGWSHTKGMPFSVVTGTQAERVAALARDVPIHIINRENLTWAIRHLRGRIKWDAIAYDECSRLRAGSPKTKPRLRQDGTEFAGRLSEFGWLLHLRPMLKRLILLTGTPAPKGLQNLWAPIHLIDLGKRLGRTKTAFHNKWFFKGRNGFSLHPREGAVKEVTQKISDVAASYLAKDHIKVAAFKPNPIWIDLPPKLRRQYQEFKRDMLLTLKVSERDLEDFDTVDIEASNAGVLVGKLMQFCNGAIYDQDRGVHHLHDLKLEALDRILHESLGNPVLTTYLYQHDRDRIMAAFKGTELMDTGAAVIRRWKEGKVEHGLGHAASMGHGLNLQSGGSTCVWFGVTTDLELYQQFNARLARSGQKALFVMGHHILVRGTVDEVNYRSLQDKDASQQRIMRRLRRHISE